MTGRPDAAPVALVHDYFVQDGGAEACAVEFARLLPSASVYTSFFDAARFGDRIDPARVRTWPIQRVPGAARRFRVFLPLYPVYFSLLRPMRASLVLSSSSAFAHGVGSSPGALHVAYIYTPMRFGWDLDAYLRSSSYGRASHLAGRALEPVLRRWDRRAARRPDVLVAISRTVQLRIERLWHRDAELIHPPVETARFAVTSRDDGYLLVASRLLAYRRVDLAVAACRRLGHELVVVGDGPERRRLEAAAGPRTTFLGHVPRSRLIELFEACHAYLVPGIEDFGIAPVEAMAAGKPVVAFAGGGAMETVIDGRTGVFFERPTADALAEAIERLGSLRIDPDEARAQAARFDVSVFRRRWRELLGRHGVDPALLSAMP
jgi:glycosyltransferase involved in cell wall biosynthesis